MNEIMNRISEAQASQVGLHPKGTQLALYLGAIESAQLSEWARTQEFSFTKQALFGGRPRVDGMVVFEVTAYKHLGVGVLHE